MAYRNEDGCHFEHIGDDIKTWCLGDEATCFNMAGGMTRMVENFLPLIFNWADVFHTLKANDICSTDEELISEYASAWGSICENAVIVHGMEPLTWNKDLKLDHINQSDFKKIKEGIQESQQILGKDCLE